MNILVIGNGFDLAHGLPTRYTDFLDFIKSFIDCYKKAQNNQIDWVYYDTHKESNAFLKKWFSSFYENDNGQSKAEKEAAVKIIEELKENIESNIWIEYFLQNPMYQKENWIDFENEISKVIQSLDNDMHGLSRIYTIEDDITNLSNSFLSEVYSKYTFTTQTINLLANENTSETITFKEIRNRLLDDLNKLVKALEIYLCEYVEKIKIQRKSQDINKLAIHHVLSFNYTHTFELSNLYKIDIRIEKTEKSDLVLFDYIHGETKINNTIELNNMVLGIDEYLPEKRKDKDIEFVGFKKYYQRIYKQTGCEYKNWVEKIRRFKQEVDEKLKNQYPLQIPYGEVPNKYRNQLYIFGHSLDATDKDVLRDLILNDNVYTTIFYPNKEELGRKIANLVKVIGQDELIRRTGGSTKTIEFKQQQDMIKIS